MVELAAAPVMTGLCHCRDCQAAGGTAFSIVGFVPAAAVRIGGEPRSHALTATSGALVRRTFCGNCGSPVTTRTAMLDEQGFVIVKLGLFADLCRVMPAIKGVLRPAPPMAGSACGHCHLRGDAASSRVIPR